MLAEQHNPEWALTRDARTQLLSRLEVLTNLLYLVQHDARHSNEHLAEIRQMLEQTTTLVINMHEC